MTNLLVLYRGNTLSDLHLVCGTADPEINLLFTEIMKDTLDEDEYIIQMRNDEQAQENCQQRSAD